MEVLLNQFQESPYPFLPGGHIDSGERAVGALERELVEELGVACRVARYLGAVEHQWPDDSPTDQEINHVFLVECPELGDRPASLEANLRFYWQPVDALDSCHIRPQVLPRLIAAYVAGDRRPWWASTIDPRS